MKNNIVYRGSHLMVCERCRALESSVDIGSRLLLFGSSRKGLFLKTVKQAPSQRASGLTPHLIGRVRYNGGQVYFLTVCAVEGCGWKGDENLFITPDGKIIKGVLFEVLEQKVKILPRGDFEEITQNTEESRTYMFM